MPKRCSAVVMSFEGLYRSDCRRGYEGHSHATHVRSVALRVPWVAMSQVAKLTIRVGIYTKPEILSQRKYQALSTRLAANRYCSRRQCIDITRTQNIHLTVSQSHREQFCILVTQGTVREAVPQTAALPLCCHIPAIQHFTRNVCNVTWNVHVNNGISWSKWRQLTGRRTYLVMMPLG